ncbi:GNAT family N-acetyltransferase [Botrimarina hoheduenensis]|uniref:Mycothiol acetyltransferase n=1 Tax=Botrimarina hoheduenensis TaxID=2528000 RepID=A0A5C5VW53_9BACT|nr:GNAT family N-acetyltransferase [Botrimarina hoheduenensis]TWT42848.1 Mycothiol acetyltransferase [Botrimarina hoheduenensis]
MASPDFDFDTATHAERHAALALVLCEVAPAARGSLVEAVAAQPIEKLGALEGLIVARRQGKVVAAAWAQPQVGNAVTMWLPEAIDQHAENAGPGLLQAAVARADSAGVATCQAVVENANDPRIAALESAGFEAIAELTYLSRTITTPPARNVAPGMSFAVVDKSGLLNLVPLIRATYQGSLDCPELGERRSIADTLQGYAAIGTSGTKGWRTVALDSLVEGVLFVALHHDNEQAELVYMGLTPKARRRGWGRPIVEEALHIAAGWGAERLITAADVRNTPALRVYEQAGFEPWCQRHAYLRFRPQPAV